MDRHGQCGGCGCSGGARRKTRKLKRAGRDGVVKQIQARQNALRGQGKKVGGTVVGDALLAGTALGLYSYFTKKRGGQKLPHRKTKKALV